ncbi:MAG: RNA 2',3'-cyclic phosphodiesterase [Thermoplasmata archaeon]|nr:RNA 2',3'-cyclic phosphodiesterase [Thermoplasmata archaeon]
MRAFASIPVSSAELSGLPAPLEPHLTLRFWVDLEERRVPFVFEALDAAAARSRAFRLELAGVGAFPSVDRPRVVWVGIGRGGIELGGLQRALAEELVARGEAPEPRSFSPHVTLFRVRSAAGLPRARSALEVGGARSFGEIVVDRVELHSSRLGPGGAVHERLRSTRLA